MKSGKKYFGKSVVKEQNWDDKMIKWDDKIKHPLNTFIKIIV